MRVIAAVALLGLFPAVALAEGIGGSSSVGAVVEGHAFVTKSPLPTTFGTASKIFYTLTAWDFQPIDSSVTFDLVNSPAGQGITHTGGPSFFKASLHLPAGALVTEVEFNYCDTGAGDLTAFLFRQPKNALEVATDLLASVGSPGCVVETATLATPITIDNDANSYNIEAGLHSTDGSVVLVAARVGYFLQVSPAPGAATFGDVPTSHEFFRYVEALVASGITAGCGGGLYCPDAPLTRGQMAVFLSKALGLHFAP
jgi:hypothetical protein